MQVIFYFLKNNKILNFFIKKKLNPQDAKKGIGYILKSTVSKFGIGGIF